MAWMKRNAQDNKSEEKVYATTNLLYFTASRGECVWENREAFVSLNDFNLVTNLNSWTKLHFFFMFVIQQTSVLGKIW